MSNLEPWARGPFELILHAERHMKDGGDFDRRMALISYDNALEVCISTYLSLHPLQRQGRSYANADVEKWLQNYHTMLDFLEQELQARGMTWQVERAHIVWAHDHRGEQYHGGKKGTPEKDTLLLIRKAALWVFSVLYNVADAESVLTSEIAGGSPPSPPEPDPHLSRAIDNACGMVEVAGQPYHTSELLFATDHDAYQEIGAGLLGSATEQEQAGAETQE